MKKMPRTGEKVVEVVINNSHSPSPHNSRDQIAKLEASNNSDDTEPNSRFDNKPDQSAQLEASSNLNDTELNNRSYNDQIAQLEASDNSVDTELNTSRPKRRRFNNNFNQVAQLEASDNSDDTELNPPRPERRRFDNILDNILGNISDNVPDNILDNIPDQIARQEDKNYSNDPQPRERESVPSGSTCDNQVTEILSQLAILNTKQEKIGSTTANQIHDLKREIEDLNKALSLKETQIEIIGKEMVDMLEKKTDEWREDLKKMAADWKDELIETILQRNPSHVSLQWRHKKVE